MPPEGAGLEPTSQTMHRVRAGHGSAQNRPPEAPPSHHGCSLPQGITNIPMSSSPDRCKSWAAQPNAQGRSSEADQAAAVNLRSLHQGQAPDQLGHCCTAKMAEDMVPTVSDLAEVYGLQGADQHQDGKINRKLCLGSELTAMASLQGCQLPRSATQGSQMHLRQSSEPSPSYLLAPQVGHTRHARRQISIVIPGSLLEIW